MVQIFFGGSQHALCIEECSQLRAESAFRIFPFEGLQKKYHLTDMMLLNQEHGIQGIVVSKEEPLRAVNLRHYKGDFLVTNQKTIGLSVLTADCLPLVFYDVEHAAIGVAHAGWRGSVKGIAQKTLETMQKEYRTRVEAVKVFFGPCAKNCCYEVDAPFLERLDGDAFAQQSIVQRGKKHYFDLPLYNSFKLRAMGVAADSLHFQENRCTMCTPNYCSYRGQNGTKMRNITVVSLKS